MRASVRRHRGLFITFEGPEGVGKSTHSRLLAGWLRRRGYPVLLAREPGGTSIGRRLRKILLDTQPGSMDAVVEFLLYEASRSLLVSQVIRPALRAGKAVILDRFQDSTWVYQGWAGKLDLKLVEKVGAIATGSLKPDRTVVLDLPVREGLARVKRPNRMEAKPVSFHERVRRGYHVLARRERSRIRLIRADRSIAQVQRSIREAVADVV